MSEGIRLFPTGKIWSEDEMFGIVTAIRWFRAIGSPDSHLYEITPEMLTPDLHELVDYLMSEELLDGEIRIFSHEGADHWSWQLLPMPRGWAVWNNNVGRIDEAPSAST